MSSATIAAISTPLGTGGIGIVRVSGPAAFDVAGRVFRSNSGIFPKDMKGFTSCLGRIMDGETALDDAICQIYRAPKSYTGENVAELSCHGGVWILQKTLRLCLENGAEAACPGEFTKRAFVNGKLNLTQAEAVMDMIHAQGQSAMKAAISARDGAISNQVGKVANDLLGQSAHLAAWADFPDEDLEKLDLNAVSNTLRNCVNALDKLLASYDAGKILREGISAAIVGKPNVGKSTLMNLLSGSQRSIVTDIPGTTRDVVEDTVMLGDFVLRLADTAGIRETDDPVEIAGVERSRLQMQTAELVFAVFDSSDTLTPEDSDLLEQLEDMPCIAVINKIDLPQKLDLSAIESKIPYTVNISAKSGTGLEELESVAVKLLGLSSFDVSAGIIANERQRLCVIQARDSLVEAESALANAMLDAVNVCIDFALDALFTLTGERASDKVVDEVFARFCVGK